MVCTLIPESRNSNCRTRQVEGNAAFSIALAFKPASGDGKVGAAFKLGPHPFCWPLTPPALFSKMALV